jgi:hypothetical protein
MKSTGWPWKPAKNPARAILNPHQNLVTPPENQSRHYYWAILKTFDAWPLLSAFFYVLRFRENNSKSDHGSNSKATLEVIPTPVAKATAIAELSPSSYPFIYAHSTKRVQLVNTGWTLLFTG